MSRLTDRNRQIPNGLTFHIPETDWRSFPFASFDAIVQNAIAHVRANPAIQGKYSVRYEEMADLVDRFNASICEQNGWKDFIRAEGEAAQPLPFPYQPRESQRSQLPSSPLPSPSPSLLNRLANVADGGETIVDWLKSGAEACPPELATARAEVCSECPLNGQGGLESYFTKLASSAIVAALNARREMQLSTPYDHQLGVCDACSCPLKLKVHFPIEALQVRLEDAVVQKLHYACWIRNELLHASGT